MSVDATTVPGQRAPAARLALVEAYLAGWDAHDGAAVAALVTGTYADPTLAEPVRGPALAGLVDGLAAAFPDLRFDTDGPPVVGDDRVVVTWRMRGTNDGAPLPGAPAPTGGTVDLPGVDVFTFDGDRLRDVRGYFDQQTFLEQLGLKVVVTAADEWPVWTGSSVRVDLGHLTRPGALSMTWIEVADDAEQAELTARSTEVVTALASEPAFLGFQATQVSRRNTTLTLWTSPEAAAGALARSAPHRDGVARMATGFGARAFTSIWQPYRLNAQLVTCTCGRSVPVADQATSAACACGSEVQVQPYV